MVRQNLFYYIEDIFHWFLRLIVFANIMHKGEMKIAPLLILNEISIAEILSKDAYNRFFCLEYIYAQLQQHWKQFVQFSLRFRIELTSLLSYCRTRCYQEGKKSKPNYKKRVDETIKQVVNRYQQIINCLFYILYTWSTLSIICVIVATENMLDLD